MPLPTEVYDYDKYLTPDYLLNKENVDNSNNETKFNFVL